MKKLMSIIMAALLICALMAGCGGSSSTSSETSDSAASAESTSTSKSVLTAAANIDYAPFEFYEDGVAVGFDVDLWNAICDYLGYEAEFIHFPWDGLISGIQADKFDAIVADMEVTEERMESVLFTDTYFYETIGICSLADSGVVSTDDLAGKTVGIQTGTVAESWAKEHQEELGVAEYVTYETMADAIMDLKAGRTSAVINNGPYMQYQATIDAEIIVVAIIDDEPIECAIAFNMEDEALRNEVNSALLALIADGTYATIYETWFGAEPSDIFMPAE